MIILAKPINQENIVQRIWTVFLSKDIGTFTPSEMLKMADWLLMYGTLHVKPVREKD